MRPNHTQISQVEIAPNYIFRCIDIFRNQNYLNNTALPKEMVLFDGAKGFQSLLTGSSKVGVIEGEDEGTNTLSNKTHYLAAK